MEEPDQPVSLPITDVFDLHTVPPREARSITEEYLFQARERGYRYVRIIHGKGIGAQRDMVRTLLKGLPFVTSFSDAPMEAGGWGATVVTLNPMAADVDDAENTPCS